MIRIQMFVPQINKGSHGKPKLFDDMTPAEKDAFRKKPDRKFKPIPALVAPAAPAEAKLNP